MTVVFSDSDIWGNVDVRARDDRYIGTIRCIGGVLDGPTAYRLSDMLACSMDMEPRDFAALQEAKLFVAMRHERMGKSPKLDEMKGATVRFAGDGSDGNHVVVTDLNGAVLGHIGARKTVLIGPDGDQPIIRYCMSQPLVQVLDCVDMEFETLNAAKAFVIARHATLLQPLKVRDVTPSPSGSRRVMNLF